MPMMKAARVPRAGGNFELVTLPLPEPQAGQVRIKVQACGICHSDALVKEGGFLPIDYPRIPGHEVAGVIDAVGTGISSWRVGQRVGVGWLLALSPVTLAIPGTGSLAHLEENIAAGSITLTPEELPDLDSTGEEQR